MAERFDPYHRWLAIPPHEQPPNHYRLLGLANFEADADVIESAADRQMGHVRSHQSGKHAQHVDPVLNEISAAKRVLLDPQKKLDYDAQLRVQTAKPAAKAPPPVAQPVATPPVEPPPAAPTAPKPSGVPMTRPAPQAKSPSTIAPLVVAVVCMVAVLLLLVAGGAAAMWWLRDSAQQVAVVTKPTVAPIAPVEIETSDDTTPPVDDVESEPTPEPPVETSDLAPIDQPDEPPAETIVEEPLPVEPADEPSSEPPAETTAPEPTGPPRHIAALFRNQGEELRTPVPDADTRQTNAQRIAKLFPDGNARTADAKSELAKRLLKTGIETGDDADSQFELLDRARVLAAEAGDVEAALAAAAELSQRFAVDGDAALAATVSALAEAPAPIERRQELVARGVALIDEMLGRDRYVEAAKLINLLTVVARRNRDTEQVAALVARQKVGSELYAGYKAAQPAIERLRTEPGDADAALAAGTFYAFIKGDWQIGLPLLAAGSDAELRRLAELEINSQPDSAAQKSLADGWYALAGSDKTSAADRQRARARLWYGKIVGRLSGLPKVEAEQRIEELAKVTVDGGAPYGAMAAPFTIADVEHDPTRPPRKTEPKVIDLLTLIADQGVDPQWQFDTQQRLQATGRASRLAVPLALPRAYLLEAVVVDLTPQSAGVPFTLMLGQEQRSFYVEIDGRLSKNELYSGVQPIDGVQSSVNGLAFRRQAMRSDRPNVIRYLVGEDRLVVSINGVNIIAFEGDMRRIGSERPDAAARIEIVPGRQDWAIASLKLAPLSDEPAPPAEPDVADAGDQGDDDLDPADEVADGKLRPINFGKRIGAHVIEGDWQGRGAQLHVAPLAGAARLQLPEKPADEYHLQIEATRRGAGSELAIGLVYQGVQCVVALDRADQTSSAIVGHSVTGAGEKDFVVSREREILPAGVRVTIDCVVHSDSFSVSIDGEKFLEFSGDANWDGPGDTWSVRDGDTLFLGAASAEFDIHAVRLGALVDQDADDAAVGDVGQDSK